jgi:mannan endo-1,6-alpha-mannosidase
VQNGGFFQLASRLARYTGNETYTQWAEKMWNWLDQSTLINKQDPTTWKINDGAGIDNGCTDPNPGQYSYNYGILIGGLAYIYSHVSLTSAHND